MLTIRPYRKTDRNILRNLVLQLHETLRPFDADLVPGDRIMEYYFHDLIMMVEQTAGEIFIAEYDKRAVGYVCLWGSVAPDGLDERPDLYCFMAELFVCPDYRSCGIGRLLVAQAESYAGRCGRYKIELKVLAHNESAVRFYEELGYAPRVIVMSKRVQTTGSDEAF